MERFTNLQSIEDLTELFCNECGLLERRKSGRCPTGQATCGAQINQI
ncbi:MAG: hypothetical protein JNM06_03535, partial [Blastocatellia bacterium]|nr:hypothetical protein [Blastocatellia bacterium]